MLEISKNLDIYNVEKIINLYETMNRQQQEDGYGEVKIPIAILKHLDDQNLEQTQVFCSSSEALLAWKSLLTNKTPAIL